ncbi:hypothetical protein TA3x_005525 [Tundrisphaera sp. TA3]|uniref:hypothetical protein n=1 Tax=Tundrisphaera sp. TA3 TaxID=3435775 RepID=UPI003EB7A005
MTRTTLRRFLAVAALGATAACFAPGCGGDWKAATVPATGRVTVNGKPASGLLVQLHPIGTQVDARNSRPWGKVQDDGTFSLSAYEDREGVPPGDYAVTLIWPVDSSVMGSPDRLGRRYDKADRSKWKVSIKPGEDNALPPIDLTDVAVQEKPKISAFDKQVLMP